MHTKEPRKEHELELRLSETLIMMEEQEEMVKPIMDDEEGNGSTLPRLAHLPDPLDSLIFSYCDFPSLLSLRMTGDRRLKGLAEKEMEKRAIKSLPLSTETNDDEGEFASLATLHLGWSDAYRSFDGLVQKALQYADPSLDADYDERRAEQLLRERGWVDVTDFLGDDSEEEEEEHYYSDEVGWRVTAHFERDFNVKRAFRLIDSQGGTTLLRQCLFSLLVTNIRSSSIRYASMSYQYRHTDYPNTHGKSFALMFQTSDNQQVELKHIGSSCP